MSRITTTVKLPTLTEATGEVVVLEWHCHIGETVNRGAPLMTVETDKVEAEVPSPVDGQILELLVEEEAEIAAGTPICLIESVSDEAK